MQTLDPLDCWLGKRLRIPQDELESVAGVREVWTEGKKDTSSYIFYILGRLYRKRLSAGVHSRVDRI